MENIQTLIQLPSIESDASELQVGCGKISTENFDLTNVMAIPFETAVQTLEKI